MKQELINENKGALLTADPMQVCDQPEVLLREGYVIEFFSSLPESNEQKLSGVILKFRMMEWGSIWATVKDIVNSNEESISLTNWFNELQDGKLRN